MGCGCCCSEMASADKCGSSKPFSVSALGAALGVACGAFKSKIGASSVVFSNCPCASSVTETQPTNLRLISKRHRYMMLFLGFDNTKNSIGRKF